MSDLGTDAGQSALSLTAKVVEALLKLIDKLYEGWLERGRRKVTKQQLVELKSNNQRKKALENLNGKTGYVKYKQLKKSGLPLRACGIYMTESEMKSFSELCKREGILFSGITDGAKEKDGVKAYEIIVKSEDLSAIRGIVDRLNQEAMIAELDKRIDVLQSKGENLTEQEKVDLDFLLAQKRDLQKSYCETLNKEMADNVIETAVNGKAEKPLTLDEALNRLTGRSIDKDIHTIVADAYDPSRYILCHGHADTYNGKDYIKTEYEVHKNGEIVLNTHDGRFDNRPENYWAEQKKAIQEAGDFSGTFFKFYSAEEYQKWAEITRKENQQELSGMDEKEVVEKNYTSIIDKLEGQLESNGAVIKEGRLFDKETDKPFAIEANEPDEKKALIAESIVISKQINNYKELESLSVEVNIAKSDVITTLEGTPEREAAEEKLSKLESRFEAAVKTETELVNERRAINALQSELKVRDEGVKEIAYLPEDKSKIDALQTKLDETRKQLYEIPDSELASKKAKRTELGAMERELFDMKQIAEQKAIAAEHPENIHGDRVSEFDADRMTLEEAVGEIQDRKANQGAKTNDVADKSINDRDKAKDKATKTKTQAER